MLFVLAWACQIGDRQGWFPIFVPGYVNGHILWHVLTAGAIGLVVLTCFKKTAKGSS